VFLQNGDFTNFALILRCLRRGSSLGEKAPGKSAAKVKTGTAISWGAIDLSRHPVQILGIH